jgi:hypothetical protein
VTLLRFESPKKMIFDREMGWRKEERMWPEHTEDGDMPWMTPQATTTLEGNLLY